MKNTTKPEPTWRDVKAKLEGYDRAGLLWGTVTAFTGPSLQMLVFEGAYACSVGRSVRLYGQFFRDGWRSTRLPTTDIRSKSTPTQFAAPHPVDQTAALYPCDW
jgi:hypothetical protein